MRLKNSMKNSDSNRCFWQIATLGFLGNIATAGVSYSEDLFYIAPIYHKAFSKLNKIIFLDSKDLEWRCDIFLLYQQFDYMGPEKLIAIAPDLTPHYRSELRYYIDQHPNTSLGHGFNIII